MTKHSITIEVDTDNLRNIEDSYLAALWQVAQLNPAPASDWDASSIVSTLSHEILRRWLSAAPVLQYNRHAAEYAMETLRKHGSWPGPKHDTWVYEPGKAERDTNSTEKAP